MVLGMTRYFLSFVIPAETKSTVATTYEAPNLRWRIVFSPCPPEAGL